MNTKQTIHTAQLEKWAALIQDQAKSGLTVREWCSLNNLTIHKYNYWKHLLKEECVSSLLPEIVPVSIPAACEVQSIPSNPEVIESHIHSSSQSCIRITLNDVHLDIPPSASEAFIARIIKAVRYA